jgi:hypothetical protein
LLDNGSVTGDIVLTVETAFSARSLPRLDNDEQLSFEQSPETTVRKVGAWCKMAASPRVEERPLLEVTTKQQSEDHN